jgi:hypothetical protein
MYKSLEFRNFFLNEVGASPNTWNTYNSYLGRITRALGGLDEAIARDGADAVLLWGDTTVEPPFDVRPSQARSVLKRYVNFVTGRGFENPDDVGAAELPGSDVAGEAEAASGLAFRLEREMQAAVRKQLSALEPGLVEADGGIEVSVETGRIDILARDARGALVVIELKAGVCPPGAIEQALGYAQSLFEDRNERIRVIVIASEFPSRMRAAARRITDLRLATYEFALKFSPPDGDVVGHNAPD